MHIFLVQKVLVFNQVLIHVRNVLWSSRLVFQFEIFPQIQFCSWLLTLWLKRPYVWYESFIGKIKESKSLLFERSQLSRENQWGWTIQYGPYSNLITIYILGCKIFHFLEVSNYNPKPNVSLIYKKATFLENVSLLWIRWNSLNVQKEIQTVKVG